jgi:hypothetical protein
MVEVFRTNVNTTDQAQMLIEQIHRVFEDYKANFDLEDCDKILRVESYIGPVVSAAVIDLMLSFGFKVDVLPDEAPWMHGKANLDTIPAMAGSK